MELPECRHIECIAVSDDDESVEEVKEDGFDGHAFTPVNGYLWRAMVKTVVTYDRSV